jgi:hypothetical protein
MSRTRLDPGPGCLGTAIESSQGIRHSLLELRRALKSARVGETKP